MELLAKAIISFSIISVVLGALGADIDAPNIIKSRTKRVVGGSPVSIESFPFVASLRAPFTGDHFCGGTILNPFVILTAAHCLAAFPANFISVQVGSDLVLPSRSHRIDVAEAIIHEGYIDNSTWKAYLIRNDVALIRLRSSITTISPVGNLTVPQSVTLFERNKKVPAYSDATVVGWGAIEEPGEEYSPQRELNKVLSRGMWTRENLFPTWLMGAEVRTVPSEICSLSYNGEEFGEDRLCAYYAGRDSCVGDSGGPLMIGSAQAGIVSTGEECAKRNSPGIYTSVAFFREWIDRNVEVLMKRAAT